jgi:hypothetical protein
VDRGKILERQWSTINVSFRELFDGERAGLVPSLILSPMIVETGQPLLISNLDLSTLGGNKTEEAIEFFTLFPESRRSFKISTAVRMNATFPFISPAVSLPTIPERRLVDAGYYDNYGINLAVGYLLQDGVRQWIAANTSGVTIIQIRAFALRDGLATGPSNSCGVAPASMPNEAPAGSISRAFQWLTSPIEGVAAARGASMIFRNNQELRTAQLIYGESFFRTFKFENTAQASLSWYLPKVELEDMRNDLDSAANKAEFLCLTDFWRSSPKPNQQ